MKIVSTKTITMLAISVAALSWIGSSTGIVQLISNESSALVLIIAFFGSILVQSLMAVFFTVSISAMTIHLRTRILYFVGYMATFGISTVLAVAFWVNLTGQHKNVLIADLMATREAVVTQGEEVLTKLTAISESISTALDAAKTNRDEEASNCQARCLFWETQITGLQSAKTAVTGLQSGVEAGLSKASTESDRVGLDASLRSAINAAAKSTVTTDLGAMIGQAKTQQPKLAQSADHVRRWTRFVTLLDTLEARIEGNEIQSYQQANESEFAGSNGDKKYALDIVTRFVTGKSLSFNEKLAIALALLTDMLFAILLILRKESRRTDDELALVEFYAPQVSAFKERLKRIGNEDSVSKAVETLQLNGKGLLGFDRLFGLIVKVPEPAGKSRLAQTVSLLKNDGTALDVSAFANLLAPMMGHASAPGDARGRQGVDKSITVLIPPANWRVLNRFKMVEDLTPPEDKGTLGHFIQQQRRKRPRVFTKTKVGVLDRYFSSGMEANLGELDPARIQRIFEAYRSDPKAKKLKRVTREKHEAIFHEAIDTAAAEGMLPVSGLRRVA